MAEQPDNRFFHWTWLGYPLAAVAGGALLGRIAGGYPHGTNLLGCLSPAIVECLVAIGWMVVGAIVVAAAVVFLCGFTDGGGLWLRLTRGLAGCILAVLLLSFGVGAPIAVCVALAALSLWVGLGAGPYLGALFGAASVALALGSAAVCLVCLRPVGRVFVNAKREAMSDGEENT